MTGIVKIYFCQIVPEIRAFRLKKSNIQVQSTASPKFFWQLKFSKTLLKWGEKNEVSLTDNFYGFAGLYHQYVFQMRQEDAAMPD